MLLKKLSALSLLSLTIATSALAAQMERQPVKASDWDEVNTTFKFRAHPIHPKLIQIFDNGPADQRTPIVASIDVAASFDTNAFQVGEVTGKPSELVIWQPDPKESSGYFYHWVGRLKNGNHVLLAKPLGNGRQYEPSDLYVVKFEKGSGYEAESGLAYERLLLTVVSTYAIGDRGDAEVNLAGDQINLTMTKHNGEVSHVVLQSQAKEVR